MFSYRNKLETAGASSAAPTSALRVCTHAGPPPGSQDSAPGVSNRTAAVSPTSPTVTGTLKREKDGASRRLGMPSPRPAEPHRTRLSSRATHQEGARPLSQEGRQETDSSSLCDLALAPHGAKPGNPGRSLSSWEQTGKDPRASSLQAEHSCRIPSYPGAHPRPPGLTAPAAGRGIRTPGNDLFHRGDKVTTPGEGHPSLRQGACRLLVSSCRATFSREVPGDTLAMIKGPHGLSGYKQPRRLTAFTARDSLPPKHPPAQTAGAQALRDVTDMPLIL